ncbi:hypothetical protein [Priestia megaterium]|uniref:hypothetical protein n=1 Tax=Priestia megaterium TaxID=1404 RepID=UPI000D5114BD|nr:hypothetical protein [Priestia megaterium]PVE64401.1 hypothetical protein DC428_23155 [Priestia megaterium]PVE79933.1 hypothetical protein DC421_24465 [Priestia megaterium]PVE81433.1 hypothetical protein DC426_25140 [Priestia megaterium]PVE91566.1 hypothetical protein DC433_26505 [Priestia megaterium]PVE99482.1 hypothetical protein DC433_12680 [Priestia megaterium]
MLKKSQKFILSLVLMLGLSSILIPTANAQDISSKEDAVNESLFYSPYEDKVIFDKEKALSLNDQLTDGDIKIVESYINNLDSDTIDDILVDNGYDLEDVKVDTDLAHANLIWLVPIAIIGILTAGTILFTSKYLSYKEKKNLVDKCYSHGGYPQIDSKDKSGVNGKPKAGSGSSSGSYSFKCIKK